MAANQKWIAAVTWWMSRYKHARYATHDCRVNLCELTAEEIFWLPEITRPWLDFAPVMLRGVVKHETKAEVRRGIAYLTELHERQAEAREVVAKAWKDEWNGCLEVLLAPAEDQHEMTKLWLEKFHPSGI